MHEPFVLLDDARDEGAADARLYRKPHEIVVAWRAQDVEAALTRIGELAAGGADMAGYLAYEAGLSLEPHLRGRLEGREGAAGPLVWFAAFDGYERIAPDAVPARLAGLAHGPPGSIGPLDPQLSPGDYCARFSAMHEAIHAGDIYQANLTFPLAGSWQGDPVSLYARLRDAARAGYGGIVNTGSEWLLSLSPELFFTLRGRSLLARPMKGTRPRGRSAAEDSANRDELAASIKDKAENLMIVDLMRNDLSRVALPGTVGVDKPFAIESYPTVHQMVSTVRAQLREGLGAIDVLRAIFPCGSITGAPKIRAMELIDDLEGAARGPYCGSIGRIDASGDAAFNVAIRTLRLTPGEHGDGRAALGVGSAIVADSQAMGEWRECLVKGGFVHRSSPDLQAARFDLIETMAFTPEDGIALLDMHMARLARSAHELGFSFDRHAIKNAIQALCFDAEEAAKVRLLLARSGHFSLELSPMPEAAAGALACAALPLPVDTGDWRLRHKSTHRWFYDAGREVALGAGAGEAIFVRDDGLVTEGCIANVFVERDGTMLTPPARLGLLPGVLRARLLEDGKAREAELTLDDLAGGFLLGNAVRGLFAARLLT